MVTGKTKILIMQNMGDSDYFDERLKFKSDFSPKKP
jgi:hypothetical protein